MSRAATTVLCASLLAGCVVAREPVARAGRFSHDPLREVSGIAPSSVPGTFWVHNDGGNEARLFAVNLEGDVVVPSALRERFVKVPWPGVAVVGAANVDWEDITMSDGELFIADMGNNGNARRDLGVYALPEPDPFTADRSSAARFIPVRYPDQTDYPGDTWQFDCEAMFAADGKLYFLTKHRNRGSFFGVEPGTKLYRLDSESTTSDNVLTLLGRRDDIGAPTGADVSPSGEKLAVLSYNGVWVFERPVSGDNWLSGEVSSFRFPLGSMGLLEAITWIDESRLVIANENRAVLTLDLAGFSTVD